MPSSTTSRMPSSRTTSANARSSSTSASMRSEIVSQPETLQQSGAPAPDPRSALPTSPGGTFGRLMRFAIANIRRRPERFALSVLGIALAIAAVTVVRTISTSFAITGGY